MTRAWKTGPAERANEVDRTLSVAPMMECTDRHDRFLLRLISRRVLLYTEMVSTGALLHGAPQRHLEFDPSEHPVALQLGGSDPREMAECARMAARRGYDEVNINVGCPSDRVHAGRFGACLMVEPALVADCVRAMRDAADVPVTVKTRIGVDERDGYEHLAEFVHTVSAAGCTSFIVHARKAWLRGLSPRQNREMPPLRYDVVYRLKRDFPRLEVILNGGIRRLEEVCAHLEHVDGAMIGRAAYADPLLLVRADADLFGEVAPARTRREILERYIRYAARQRAAGVPLPRLTRHLLGLYQGVAGARAWRRHLSEEARRPGAGVEVIRKALRHVEPGTQEPPPTPASAASTSRPTPLPA